MSNFQDLASPTQIKIEETYIWLLKTDLKCVVYNIVNVTSSTSFMVILFLASLSSPLVMNPSLFLSMAAKAERLWIDRYRKSLYRKQFIYYLVQPEVRIVYSYGTKNFKRNVKQRIPKTKRR